MKDLTISSNPMMPTQRMEKEMRGKKEEAPIACNEASVRNKG